MNHTTDYVFNEYSPVFRPIQQHQNGIVSSARVTNEPSENEKKEKTRCHGNLKLQRIRRRQRKQQMKKDQMECSVDKPDTFKSTTEIKSTNCDTDNRRMNTDTVSKPTEKSKSREMSNTKRKRLTTTNEQMKLTARSLTQLSLSQTSMRKKIKRSKNPKPAKKSKKPVFGQIYQRTQYMRIGKHILLRTLRLHLKHRLKKKEEQRFILRRVQLLDEDYCITLYRKLWQLYMELSSKYQIWPKSVTQRVNGLDDNSISLMIANYLNDINDKLRQNKEQLANQSYTCPITLSLESIDKLLKDFVGVHQRRFTRKIHCYMAQFKSQIRDHQLWQELASFGMNIEQLESLERILSIQQHLFQVYEEFSTLEQRIICKLLPKSVDDIHMANNSNTLEPMNTSDINIEHKKLKEAKRTKLDELFRDYQDKLSNLELQYHQALVSFQNNHVIISYSNEKRLSLIQLMKKYVFNRFNQFKRENRFNMTLFREKLYRRRKHQLKSKRKHEIDVYPQTIIDVPTIPLNETELFYLSSTGPSYIRPNRSALRPYQPRLQLAQRDHDQLMKKMTSFLQDHCHVPSNASIIKILSKDLKEQLVSCHIAPLSIYDDSRAHQELNMVRSIRHKLKKGKLILRETDKSGVFHIGPKDDYERKAIEYRTKTGAYVELSENPLPNILSKVTHLLNDLAAKKQITIKNQHDKMMPDRKKVELSYMYFVPKAHKKNTPLRPIMNTIKAPTAAVSKFLDRLIRPLFEKHAQSTTIIDGSDLICRLHNYASNGYLRASTQLCTFDITDLYTMLPQEESLDILCEFLSQHGYRKVQGIPMDAIRKLARIVLTENAFVYSGKYYKQILGGAMGSPFTLTLANIFMWKWEKNFIRRLNETNQIYGRYIDDVFFTSNQSVQAIQQILFEANQFHPNIKLTSNVGKSVAFLDVHITNEAGQFVTSVYCKDSAEPYMIPFKSDHPRHTFGSIILGTLTRALRYSSTTELFNIATRKIRQTLLFNGYPSAFIATHYRHFFLKNRLKTTPLTGILRDDVAYYKARRSILRLPTASQSQQQKNLRNITDDPLDRENVLIIDPNEKKAQQTLNHTTVGPKRLIVHYHHERRLVSYKRQLHQTWSHIFDPTPLPAVKVIVGNKNHSNLKRELVRKKPKQTLLRQPAPINPSTK